QCIALRRLLHDPAKWFDLSQPAELSAWYRMGDERRQSHRDHSGKWSVVRSKSLSDSKRRPARADDLLVPGPRESCCERVLGEDRDCARQCASPSLGWCFGARYGAAG